MVIAVPYLDGQVNAHFGRTQAFLVAEAEGGAVKESTVYAVAGLEHDHSGLAGFLASRGVDVILAGGMGAPMQQALTRAGFELYCGVSGPAAEAVEAFLLGNIAKSEAACGHHHEGGCAH
ncbi:MAG: NifB/NifX family molybdenum-iron cluster-binding protein [Thermoleophilia bacterium]